MERNSKTDSKKGTRRIGVSALGQVVTEVARVGEEKSFPSDELMLSLIDQVVDSGRPMQFLINPEDEKIIDKKVS